MDVLNFISWIKNGQQVTTVDPTQTLIPLGLRDPRRDDGYRSGTITAQDFINSVTPPSIISVGEACNSTLRTGIGSCAKGTNSVVLGTNSSASCQSQYGVISGGNNNCVAGYTSTVGGGEYNNAFSSYSGIASGRSNQNYGSCSFIGGGYQNFIYGNMSVIGSGEFNTISSSYSYIVGGSYNNIQNSNSGILTGTSNQIAGAFGIIVGGNNNCVCNSSFGAGILGGSYNFAVCNFSYVVGTCITTNRECATFVNNLSIMNVPTSSAGLPSKSVWSNAGVLTIVP